MKRENDQFNEMMRRAHQDMERQRKNRERRNSFPRLQVSPEKETVEDVFLTDEEMYAAYPAAMEYFARHTSVHRRVQMMTGHDEWVRLPTFEEKIVFLIQAYGSFEALADGIKTSHFSQLRAGILLACNNEGGGNYNEVMTVPEIQAFLARLGYTPGVEVITQQLAELKARKLVVEVSDVKYIFRDGFVYQVQTLPGYFTDLNGWDIMSAARTFKAKDDQAPTDSQT